MLELLLTLIMYFLIAWILVKPFHSYIATPREKWTAEGWSEKAKDSFAKIDKETAIILSIIWPLILIVTIFDMVHTLIMKGINKWY